MLFTFTDWDVVYCSVPTSPGGGYRSALGRLIFKTNEMIQVIEAPDIVRNKVSFSAFGFLDGEVCLEGNYCKHCLLVESFVPVFEGNSFCLKTVNICQVLDVKIRLIRLLKSIILFWVLTISG